MTYDFAMETRDYGKIDKLNKLEDPETFWDDVGRLTRRAKSDHGLRRWEILSEIRYREINKA